MRRKLKDAPHQKPAQDVDEHEGSHYRRGQEAHWFVSTALHWRAGTNLSECLKDLRAHDKSAFPHMKTLLPAAIYRVPGPSTREYAIRNYAPHGVDALFVGFDDLSTKGMD